MNEIAKCEQLRDQFDNKLKEFDKFYEFSDDINAYNKGKVQLQGLRNIAREMGMSPNKFFELTDQSL